MTVYTDSQKLQVDGAYNNLTLLRKEIVHCPAVDCIVPTDNYWTRSYVEFNSLGKTEAGIIPHTSDVVLVCVELTDTPICMIRHEGKYKIINVSKTSKNISCYLFADKPASGGSDNVGMQVYDQQGGLTFDSTRKHMRVVDYRAITAANTDTRLLSVSLPQGKKYAICFAHFFYETVFLVDGLHDVSLTIAGARINNGVVHVDPVELHIGGNLDWHGASDSWRSLNYGHMIIDVTGY